MRFQNKPLENLGDAVIDIRKRYKAREKFYRYQKIRDYQVELITFYKKKLLKEGTYQKVHTYEKLYANMNEVSIP